MIIGDIFEKSSFIETSFMLQQPSVLFGRPCRILGIFSSKDGLMVDLAKVQAVNQWPKSTKVHSFHVLTTLQCHHNDLY